MAASSLPLRGIRNNLPFTGDISSDYLDIGFTDNEKLAKVNFSTGFDFDQIRARLVEYIQAVYPDDFNQFVESDLGMMVLELISYLGSILAFKADSLANELYISTTRTRGNARKLLQLIGIDLRGPLAAKATGATTITGLSAGDTVSITDTDIVIGTDSEGQDIHFGLYGVDRNTGEISLHQNTVSLDFEDFDDAGNTSSIAFMEGQRKTLDGTFNDLEKNISIGDPSIIEGSLVVSSNESGGTIYNEIDSLFLASGTEAVFEKVYLDDYSVTLVFGLGNRGKEPLDGADYTVFYRTGGGLRGNIPTDFINATIQATITRQAGGNETVDATLQNLTPGVGGTEAETLDKAKKFGPLLFSTQYRCVTGQDYTTVAGAFVSNQGSTGKALAVLRRSGSSANMIDIYVVEKATDVQIARADYAYKRELQEYMQQYKMLTDEITVVDGLVRTVDLVLRIVVNSELKLQEEQIKLKAITSIVDFFNVDNRNFGETIHFGDLTRKIFDDVSEIKYALVENFDVDELTLNFNEIVQLNNAEVNMRWV